jgi:5-formyltetrahydrofolate cyclo-ligase
MADPHAKAAIRAAALARRDRLPAGWREAMSHDIAERVLASGLIPETQEPIAAYWPMRSEVDTRPLIAELALKGHPLALPAVLSCANGGGANLVFRRWSPGEALVAGGFGTQTPGPQATPCQPGILIVPLSAFDRRCGRIGYGKGYYDRAIAALKLRGPLLTIGVAFSAQEVAETPMEPHDQPLDAVVTERETIRARHKRR